MKPQVEIEIPADFQATLDDNEKLLWADKPKFVPYMLSTIWHNLFILGVASFFIFTMMAAGNHSANHQSIPFTFLLIPGLLALLGIWGILSGLLSYSNTIYAVSARRVIIRTGIVAIDYRTIDYDKITDTAVNVNLFERMFGVGSVRFTNGARTSKGALIFQSFSAIKNPYEVFKELKEVTVDVKTDFNYPNALRPEKNTGYKSDYDPK